MHNNRVNTSGSWVFRIIFLNVTVYLFQGMLARNYVPYFQSGQMEVMTYWFGLTPALVILKGYVWQIVTYMFMHGGFAHIFFNMYALLLFGMPIEQLWGSKKFLFYYFFTGIGAGVTILVINLISGGDGVLIPTIGASGAVFGLLLAFGILFPDAELLIFFFIPMKAKYLVVLYGGLELYFQITSGNSSSISHIGHLGGIFFGLIYFFVMKRRGIEFRAKKIKAILRNEISKRKDDLMQQAGNTEDRLYNILQKIREGGIHSLSDDDFQYVKRMDILFEGRDGLCVEGDFSTDDDYCRKCDNYQACLMREIRKHL